MALKIHPLTENSDNINATASNAIEQEVRPRAIFAITGPYFGTSAPAGRLHGYCFDVLPELADIHFRLINARFGPFSNTTRSWRIYISGLINAPAAFGVVPDVVEV